MTKEMETTDKTNIERQLELAEQVGRLSLEGKNPTLIAQELGIPRREVTKALDDWRGLLRRSAQSGIEMQDRLMDIIFEADESFRMVIKEAWDTAKAADDQGSLAIKVNALKLVESSTKNRADMLHKSGVSQDNEIIEQLNDQEEKQRVIIELLKEIRTEHPEVAELITRRLNKISSEQEPIEVEAVVRE